MSTHRALLALSLLGACAHNASSTLHSSAASTGYALHYPELLAAAEKQLAADARRAHELDVSLAKLDQLKVSDRELCERVIDQADRAGTSDAYARARNDDRSIAAFWDDERAGIGARASAAAQKELADGSCADKDLGPAVQGALKGSLDKPRERRLRASNEAQRTLELHKARLAPGSLPAWQRAADEIALASHYAYVALPDDVRELERLLREQADVQRTLDDAIDEERKIQRDPRGGEQKASQDRVVAIEKTRAEVSPTVEQARKVTDAARAALAAAQDEYDAALKRVREHISSSSAAETSRAVASPTARSVKQ
jgi:hypothetical protein